MATRWLSVAVAAALGTALFVGSGTSCDGGESTPDDGGTDDGRDDGTGRTESNWDDGVVADFVINSMRIGTQEGGEGFNLDGITTPPGHAYLPEDGPGGTDNQLGALIAALVRAGLDFDADAEIATSIADGGLLILLRHKDVDSWSNDPGLIHLFGYAGKDSEDPEDPTNNLTGTGLLLADERSLTDLTDLDSALIQFPTGVLNDTTAADSVLQRGDFEAGPNLFQVDIPVQDDAVLHLAVNGTMIVWDLDTAPTGDPPLGGRIINGLLGGYILLGDAARAISQIDLSGTTLDVDTIRSILAGQADMDVILSGFTDDTCTDATVAADCDALQVCEPDSTRGGAMYCMRGFTDDPCTDSTEVTDCAPGQTCEPNAERGGDWFCFEQPDNPDAISLGLVFTAVSCQITGIFDDPDWPVP